MITRKISPITPPAEEASGIIRERVVVKVGGEMGGITQDDGDARYRLKGTPIPASEIVGLPTRKIHYQTIPAVTWVVPNPSGLPPVGIMLIDSAGETFGAGVQIDSIDWLSFTVHLGAAVSGTVTWF